jgi:transmembrane sensor
VNRDTARENVQELAASWYDRMHRERVPEQVRAELDAWLAKSPEHQTAYEAIERTWLSLRSLAHDQQVLALRHETALRLSRRTALRVSPMRLTIAAALLLAVGVALLLAARPNGDRSIFTALLSVFHGHNEAQYVTATGERLVVNLEDGTQVTLDTETALTVGFSHNARRVRLARGQALFEVAKDPTRPFIVEVQRRRLVAVGTAFDVRLDGERVKVTMIEGTVRVEPAGSRIPNAAGVATITAGEQLVGDNRNPDSIHPADADRQTSWRHGQIIFENTRLADAITELNRYSRLKLQLADPALADLRLSGAFSTGHPQLFVEALTTYFPIEALRSDERLLLLKVRQ